jgi:HD superfamily phosphohydrolase YqeK
MTDNDMIIKLHDLARNLDAKELREIADRFAELAKANANKNND